jgi:tetratricopeptide (TPR) repeat protein
MNEHYLDLPISTASARAASAIVTFAEELVSHGQGCQSIFVALEADPECALGQAYAAALFLTLMTREGQVQAAPRISAAWVHATDATERERRTIAAVTAWGAGDTASAIRQFRQIVEIWPHDLVAAKLCQVLELGCGDAAGMVRTSGMVASIDDRDSRALGLHAFALDQNGQAELALRFARRAIDMSPASDPWAQHAAAHALAAKGLPREAHNLLRSHAPGWRRCSSFMLTHNWWHLALFSLELGDRNSALRHFDEHVWGVRKGHCQDQINAIALLVRLEMAGVAVGGRWDDVATHVAPHAEDGIDGFLDMHYLYALARAGHDEAANGLVERLSFGSFASLAKGLVAHARNDYQAAALALSPAQALLPGLGGSNIQKALFADLYADSVRRMQSASDSWKRAA